MTLREQLENTLGESTEITDRPGFRRLSHFYEDMKRAGVVFKKQYDLPQLDTLGGVCDREPISKSRRNDVAFLSD